MEAEGRGQHWRTVHLPEFKRSGRCRESPTGGGRETGQAEVERGGIGPHRSVTVVPTSRYQTDRQYVARKPLFAAERHTSILNRTHGGHKERHHGVYRGGVEEGQRHTDTNLVTRGGEAPSPGSFSPSRGDVASPPPASPEDPCSPLRVSELGVGPCREEPTSLSGLPDGRPTRQRISSFALEVQALHPPLRPRLTSTVLYPTYTPRSGYSRFGQAGHMLWGREEEEGSRGQSKLYSSGGHPRGHPMSPYQTNYWACAIPKALPPSPDRYSPGWDPDKEYQALLDYTYPMRPGQVVSGWDSSELQVDLNLQDSGIELDHRCSSTSLSGLDELNVSSAGQSGGRSTALSLGHRSTDPRGYTESSEGPPPGALLSTGLSLEASDCSEKRGREGRYESGGYRHQHHTLSAASSAAFTRSTGVPPQSGCARGEVDEEFRPLPEQLEELQLLSRQVREATARLRRPVPAGGEPLGPGTTSVLSSVTLPGKREAGAMEPEGNNGDTDEGGDETAPPHGTSAAARRTSGALPEPVRVGPSRSSLREAEALVGRLCGLGGQADRRQSDSLVQHIQVFCSHLEQLIQWLHAAPEGAEPLAGPSVDIDGVKSSLVEYQSFRQREASSHRPLASSVLHSGRLLLGCINATSPFLRDALLLIERQSGALETPH